MIIQINKTENEVIYEEPFPFKRNKDMVFPNSDICRKCKGSCCNYTDIFLKPNDFEKGKEVDCVIKLIKMGFLRIYTSGRSVFVLVKRNGPSCSFKCVWGCIIPADMRPTTCRFYGPFETEFERCSFVLDYSYTTWDTYYKEFLEKGAFGEREN